MAVSSPCTCHQRPPDFQVDELGVQAQQVWIHGESEGGVVREPGVWFCVCLGIVIRLYIC